MEANFGLFFFMGDFNLVEIPRQIVLTESKVDAIYDCFGTQRSRSWFTKETFWAILRLRGIEANSASGYAEGFYARKCVY